MAVQTKNQTIEVGIATLEFSRGATIKLLESIPPDARVLCPVKGANHATWIAGHIALTDNYFFKTVGGQSGALPESWESLFGMGSKCVSSSDAYPAWDEIMKAVPRIQRLLLTERVFSNIQFLGGGAGIVAMMTEMAKDT